MNHDTCLFARGGPEEDLSEQDLRAGLFAALDALGPRKRVLALPPDGTRAHSRAAPLLSALLEYYGDALAAVMPALGTHRPMDEADFSARFPGIPFRLCVAHDWRGSLVELGRVPAAFVRSVSDGLCDFDWPAQVNRLVAEGGFDLIVSLGQVVPHEVVGMANHSKNLFVGVGGREGINRSHWLGAAWGIERVLGRVDTPVRAVLDWAAEKFARDLPLLYALTVVGPSRAGPSASGVSGITAGEESRDCVRGLYIDCGRSGFERAAALSALVNVTDTGKPVRDMLVWLDPAEFRSTWLGNKAIYRTRLAMADGGRLTVLAPGLDRFGEDRRIDATIRAHGYRGAARARELVASGELAHDLAGAAHLAHGSSEGRFTVRYAAGGLSRAAVEGVGYEWADCADETRRLDPASLRDGWNTVNGRELYFVRNPALGLWTCRPLD